MSDEFDAISQEVLNQPPALVDYDLYSSDAALVGAVEAEGAGWAASDLAAFGQKRRVGSDVVPGQWWRLIDDLVRVSAGEGQGRIERGVERRHAPMVPCFSGCRGCAYQEVP